MQQWEFAMASVVVPGADTVEVTWTVFGEDTHTVERGGLGDWIARAGQNGWELVGATEAALTGKCLYFKRPKA